MIYLQMVLTSVSTIQPIWSLIWNNDDDNDGDDSNNNVSSNSNQFYIIEFC